MSHIKIFHFFLFSSVLFSLLITRYSGFAQGDTWIKKADMPTARLGHATCVVDGKIYVIGGYKEANSPGLTTVEVYDPATNTWTTTAPMPTGRRQLGVSVVNGKIYAIGGYTNFQQAGLSIVEKYDPVTDEWTEKADMPTARLGLATSVVDGIIYAIGGGAKVREPLQTVEAYDPATDTWIKKSNMPTARYLLSTGVVNNKIYTIGGSFGGPNQILSTVEEYEPATDSWTKKSDMPTERFNPAACVVGEKIFTIGGASGFNVLSTIEIYDPKQDKWESIASSFKARIASFVVLNEKIYAIGGALTVAPPHPAVSTVEVYTPAKNEMILWPEIEPFQSDYLKVSNIHEIYYELCGKPEGKPVFVIHGGPGTGCSPYMRRFFNPEKFLIVLHDQRGCGKSRPNAELRENTTSALVEDIERLRKKLNLDKIILFGGSWGSTLSLAYAETYPDNVSGMVLRGIWLASREELDSYWDRISKFFPETYESLKAILPDSIVPLRTDKLIDFIQSHNRNDIENDIIRIARYAAKAYGLHMSDESLDKFFTINNIDAIYTNALIESYYGANSCFLEENQLLRDAHRIQNIPTIIVNGRYDLTCPPFNAHRLNKKLPKSRLIIVEEAGHRISEQPIEKELLKVMCEFE